MLVLISGGSGSGKSEYAESIAVGLKKTMALNKLIYIAAMKPYGKEALERIERHRSMRSGKGFETIECYSNIESVYAENNSIVILECMSNLLANEMFDEKNENAQADIINGIKRLNELSGALVVVTNEIFSDGICYDNEIIDYIKTLGNINCLVAELADNVTEVVCGIPIVIKGDKL